MAQAFQLALEILVSFDVWVHLSYLNLKIKKKKTLSGSLRAVNKDIHKSEYVHTSIVQSDSVYLHNCGILLSLFSLTDSH